MDDRPRSRNSRAVTCTLHPAIVNFRVACSHYRQQDNANACIGLSLTHDLEKENPSAYGVFEVRFVEPNSLQFCLLLLYSRYHEAERIQDLRYKKIVLVFRAAPASSEESHTACCVGKYLI